MSKSKSKYASKRKTQGADSYGAWKNGEQLRADVIASRVLAFRNSHWSVTA